MMTHSHHILEQLTNQVLRGLLQGRLFESSKVETSTKSVGSWVSVGSWAHKDSNYFWVLKIDTSTLVLSDYSRVIQLQLSISFIHSSRTNKAI